MLGGIQRLAAETLAAGTFGSRSQDYMR